MYVLSSPWELVRSDVVMSPFVVLLISYRPTFFLYQFRKVITKIDIDWKAKLDSWRRQFTVNSFCYLCWLEQNQHQGVGNVLHITTLTNTPLQSLSKSIRGDKTEYSPPHMASELLGEKCFRKFEVDCIAANFPLCHNNSKIFSFSQIK